MSTTRPDRNVAREPTIEDVRQQALLVVTLLDAAVERAEEIHATGQQEQLQVLLLDAREHAGAAYSAADRLAGGTATQ